MILIILFFIIYSISVITCYNVIDILYGSSDDFCLKKIVAIFIIHIPILNTMIALSYWAWEDEDKYD